MLQGRSVQPKIKKKVTGQFKYLFQTGWIVVFCIFQGNSPFPLGCQIYVGIAICSSPLLTFLIFAGSVVISSVLFLTLVTCIFPFLSKSCHFVYFFKFPGDSDCKESACGAGDLGLIPESGRPPGEGNSHPLQYSCLENPMDRGAWQATVHGLQRVRHNWVTNTLFLMLVTWIFPPLV